MTASELYQRSMSAREVVGVPDWPFPDDPSLRDSLLYVGEGDAGFWAIGAVGVDEEEVIPIDVSLAEQLLKEHYRGWMLERGWQVQVSIRRGVATWRLVDCLSMADGGGDRLDDEYPMGVDELAVLCESVLAVLKQVRRA